MTNIVPIWCTQCGEEIGKVELWTDADSSAVYVGDESRIQFDSYQHGATAKIHYPNCLEGEDTDG